LHGIPARHAGAVDDATTTAPVRLAGLATAVPPHPLPQADVRRRLGGLLAGRIEPAWLARLAAATGIETRYGVRPAEWLAVPRGWSARARAYAEGAGALFRDVAERALATARWRAAEVDTVVTVSTTGIATPTLEARALAELGLRADVQRVPLFGLGCAGGVAGLAIARRLAAARPGGRVLVVCVETCTLNLRITEPSRADVVAALLFGDGAAAACLAHDAGPSDAPWLAAGFEHLWPDTLDVMGWDVRDDGLGVIFDRAIPAFVDAHLRRAVDDAFRARGWRLGEVDRWVCHPGGPRVLDALERALDLPAATLDHERDVLATHGNMSAPTVLFVLERVLGEGRRGPLMLAALGPGFTAAFLPVRCGEA
jgi:alkylresorcinol/alkylpyrone synthase